ncbi:MAG: cupin domain-containing protein [Proteobacteria bacterium]|nr:cupin domain-containing protein [Pseudomonadota bacterium]
MPENIKVGQRIKDLRIARGLSREDVARKSGISEETIASIESHLVSPPLGNLVSLAQVFEVSVGDFFGEKGDSSFCIVRSGDRKPVSRFNSSDGKSSGYSYEALGQQKKIKQMEPFLVTLTPAEVRQAEPNQHIGEEFLFVLEGRVEVKLMDHTDILNPGDSIYYDSTMPHIVACHGDQPATILAVIYAKDEMIIL